MTRTDNARRDDPYRDIHLAPTSTTSGSFAASVTATSVATNDTKSLHDQRHGGEQCAERWPSRRYDGERGSDGESDAPRRIRRQTRVVQQGLRTDLCDGDTTSPGTGRHWKTRIGPWISDSGTATISISISDGAGGTDAKSADGHGEQREPEPVLAQAREHDGQRGTDGESGPLGDRCGRPGTEFTKTAGPAYATVTTTLSGNGDGR